MSRIDTNHSSSVCTRSLADARPVVQRPSVEQLDTIVKARDAYESAAPGRISGPKLDDLQPRYCAVPPSMRDATGAGWSSGAGSTRAEQKAALQHVERLHGCLTDVKSAYGEWKKANPGKELSDGELSMTQILERPTHEQCVRIICVVIHEHPEVLDECRRHAGSSHEPQRCDSGRQHHHGIIPDGPRATIPSNEIDAPTAPTPSAPRAPSAPSPSPAPGAQSDFLGEMGRMFGPLAQMLGGLLQNPAVIGVLAAAAQLLNLVAPGLGVAVGAAIPLIAPLAGMLLQGLGGAMAGAPAGAPGAAPGAPGAAPAGGLDLGVLVNAFGGLMGATGGLGAPVAGAPAPTTPFAGAPAPAAGIV